MYSMLSQHVLPSHNPIHSHLVANHWERDGGATLPPNGGVVPPNAQLYIAFTILLHGGNFSAHTYQLIHESLMVVLLFRLMAMSHYLWLNN